MLQRADCILDCVAEHPNDCGERIVQFVRDAGTTGQARASQAEERDPHAGSSFAKQAIELQATGTYHAIRRDILKSHKDDSQSAVDLTKLAIMGSSAKEPDRRNNAIILTLAFDKAGKHASICQEINWLAKVVEDNLPTMLGEEVKEALRFGTQKPLLLTELAG